MRGNSRNENAAYIPEPEPPRKRFQRRRRGLRQVHVDRSHMDRQLRRVSLVVTAMFLTIMLAATIIQVGSAASLGEDPRNARTRYAAAVVQRGPIVVDGQEIARSEPVLSPTDSARPYRRVYSNPELYSHITGYFNATQGSSGLEETLNSELSGKSDSQFFGEIRRILTGRNQTGGTVTLTLNHKIQEAAAQALGEHRGAVVVLEPSTGKILGMISHPGYDPNRLANGSNSEVQEYYREEERNPTNPLYNRAIGGDTYPPGSVFKLITLAAALKSGRFALDGPLPNDAELSFPGYSYKVQNDNRSTCGPGPTTNLETALALSCNVTFAQVAQQLGGEALAATAKSFGFDTALRIPLNVTRSKYPLTSDPAELALTAFGQWEVRVTPLQVAMISATIANGGKLMKPELVERVQNPDLSIASSFQKKELGEPLNARLSGDLKQAMRAVVQRGTGEAGKISGVDVAGKTGTAENGAGRQALWFTGFAPAENPRIAVAIVLESSGGSAGSLAAPAAKEILRVALAESAKRSGA